MLVSSSSKLEYIARNRIKTLESCTNKEKLISLTKKKEKLNKIYL